MNPTAWRTTMLSTATLMACAVNVESVGAVRNACQLLRVADLDEQICVRNTECIQHDLRCEDAGYTSAVSPHTTKDWKADYADHFYKSPPGAGVNANRNAYKKWGMGEDDFFVISDNVGARDQSSRAFYFYMNGYKMPRIVGATFFDAKTGQVTEYEFEYLSTTETTFSSWPRNRALAATRTFEAQPR